MWSEHDLSWHTALKLDSRQRASGHETPAGLGQCEWGLICYLFDRPAFRKALDIQCEMGDEWQTGSDLWSKFRLSSIRRIKNWRCSFAKDFNVFCNCLDLTILVVLFMFGVGWQLASNWFFLKQLPEVPWKGVAKRRTRPGSGPSSQAVDTV